MSTVARLRELFERALDLEGDARRRWLEALRRSQPELAARIERMLAHEATQGDPLGVAVASLKSTLQVDAGARVGQRFAGFQLLRLLGEGGMGAVYLAERRGADFCQQVALKLLRDSWAGPSAARRFAGERQILARLNHPNIATLIDAGVSADGQPYLAMEYIDGKPLLAFCDAAQLDVPARLRLVQGLLSALGHAHRLLVVHGDLKPGNVLVTPDGTPRLLDFGIARLLDHEAGDARATTTRVFTPDYASPEQLAGEPVGTASDLFSLGLVLYQLCVGVLPWQVGERSRSGGVASAPGTRFRQLDEALQRRLAARRGEDAGALARRLRGELGLVLQRCLALDPAARYGSVDALQRDLQALIARQPPPGVHVGRRARAAAFVRRHAWPVAVAALVLVAGVALLGQALLGQQRLQAERDRALAAAHAAQVASATSRQIAEFADVMLSSIDPDRAQGMDRSLLRLILDAAGERAQTELAGQPVVRAAVEGTIARSYNSIGEYELAIRHFDAALEAAGGADTAQRVGLLTAQARAWSNRGDYAAATRTGAAAVELAQALPEMAPERLEAEATRAGFECDRGRFQRCREAYRQVLPLQRRVLGTGDSRTAESMRYLAYAETSLGHYAGAEALYEQLIAAARAAHGESSSETLNAINGLGIVFLQAGEFARAEALLGPAVQQAEAHFGPDHPLTINMLSNLGGAIRQQPGRNLEARPLYERVLAATRARYGRDNKRSLFAAVNLASLLRDAGELEAAGDLAAAAAERLPDALGPDSPYRAMALDTLGTIRLRQHRYAAAACALDQSWEVFAANPGFGPEHPAVRELVAHGIELGTAWQRPDVLARWQAHREPAARGAGAAVD